MKPILLILIFFTLGSSCKKNDIHSQMPATQAPHQPGNNDTTTTATNGNRQYTYLALGDSYTIGQNVPAAENYPNQLTKILRNDNLQGTAKIIATTGWTTGNLEKGITAASERGELDSVYNIVTLLIGVNNQYQGEPSTLYPPKFESLLKRSIELAGNKPEHVIVISIPDWGATPFAGVRNREEIAKEIDEYNAINKNLALKYGAGYLYVTDWTREATTDPSLLASDNLHLSGKEYERWAKRLADMTRDYLKQ
jgi:lysophospholipase L1-like esterase